MTAIRGTSTGASSLGLDAASAAKLQALLIPKYQALAANPVFATHPSILPHCLSPTKPTNGVATLFRPITENTNFPPIVFLHGYGGSFIWPLHSFAKALPNRPIVAPAHGLSSAGIRIAYLREAMRTAQLGAGRPLLMGLSAGGRAACEIYSRHPDEFCGLIVLAAPPPATTWKRFGKRHRLEFIHGSAEPFVVNGHLQGAINYLRKRNPSVGSKLVPGGDHFFLLEHAAESEKLLQAAAARILKARP